MAYGTIVGWLPPDGEDDALWHVVHDDGDEEDLDLKDVSSSDGCVVLCCRVMLTMISLSLFMISFQV